MALKVNALQKLQDASAYSKTAAEVLDFSYYDTISLLSTTLTHRYFVVPLGQAGKTLADTNMVLAGLLPQGQNMTVKAIKMFYVTDTAFATADIQLFYDLIKNTTLEFIVPGKENLGQWNLQEIMGMSTMISMIPAVAGDNIPLNMPRYHGVFPLNRSIKIGATQAFEVRLQHHVAPNSSLDGNFMMVSLYGKLIRMS